MFSTPRALPLHLALSVLLSACAESPPSTDDSYNTVAQDVERNREKAHARNLSAVKLLREKDYDAAERELKEALAADVACGPAHNNLGKVYYHQKKLYLAAWEFQYAAKLMPNQPEPRNNLGLVLETVGKLDGAVEEYDRALSLEPDNAELLGNLVRARVRRGDRSPEVRKLLEDLLLRDTRAEWVAWARETLGTLQPAAGK